MTAPWVDGEAVNAQKMYDRIEARLDALEDIVNLRPIFLGRQTIAQSLTTGTNTSINMDTEDIDSANGHSTTTNTSRYTAQKTGLYFVVGQVSYVFNATGARGAQFYVNGVAVPATRVLFGCATGAGSPPSGASTSRIMTLTAGDYVETLGWQNSGGALNTSVNAQDASSMSVYLIG